MTTVAWQYYRVGDYTIGMRLGVERVLGRDLLFPHVSQPLEDNQCHLFVDVLIGHSSELHLASSARRLRLQFHHDCALSLRRMSSYQAIIRSLAFLDQRPSKCLMHASTVRLSHGTGIMFVDDGSGIGKTCMTIEALLQGSTLVADEFSLLDTASLKVQALPNVPLHLRDDLRHYLTQRAFTSARSRYMTAADLGFRAAHEPTTVNLLVRPQVRAASRKLIEIPPDQRHSVIEACMNDHFTKLLNPSRDRVSFLKPEWGGAVKTASTTDAPNRLRLKQRGDSVKRIASIPMLDCHMTSLPDGPAMIGELVQYAEGRE